MKVNIGLVMLVLLGWILFPLILGGAEIAGFLEFIGIASAAGFLLSRFR